MNMCEIILLKCGLIFIPKRDYVETQNSLFDLKNPFQWTSVSLYTLQGSVGAGLCWFYFKDEITYQIFFLSQAGQNEEEIAQQLIDEEVEMLGRTCLSYYYYEICSCLV